MEAYAQTEYKVWPPGPRCRMYTNATSALKIGLRLSERPQGGAIKKAHWAFTRGRPCSGDGRGGTPSACKAPLVTAFQPIGHSKRLARGDVHTPLLDVRTEGVPFEHGETYFFNLQLCDALDNCGFWAHPFDLVVDQTPPPTPSVVVADRHRNTSADGSAQYWVSDTRIDPAWLFDAQYVQREESGNLVDSLAELADPDSGPVSAYVDLYQVRR